MKYININRLFIIIFVTLSSLSLCACSSDSDDETMNEWNASYVYLQRSDYLSNNIKTFSLTHDASGIAGSEISITFSARTQKPAEHDIIVDLGVISNAQEVDPDAVTFSSATAVIKAGEQVSEEITATIDRNIFNTIEDKISYSFGITINSINTENKNTIVSSNLRTISAMINKAAFLNLKSGTPTNSKLWNAKTEWSFVFQDGVENQNTNSVIGNGSSDVATNGIPFWLTVDLKTVKTITGIQAKHWSSSYAPTKIEVYSSNNGSTWKSLGAISTSGGTQNVSFISPVQTRYLKYQMITVPSRVDITGFLVYIPNE